MRTRTVIELTSLVAALSLGAVWPAQGMTARPAGRGGRNRGGDGGGGNAGATGAAGAAGAKGATGPQGPSGVADASAPDASELILTLSERAQKGLQMPSTPLASGTNGGAIGPKSAWGATSSTRRRPAATATPQRRHALPCRWRDLPARGGLTVVSAKSHLDPVTGLKDTQESVHSGRENGTDILNGQQALIVHPWQYQRWMSTFDIDAIYAFMRAIPAIHNVYAADNKASAPGVPVPFPGNYNGLVSRIYG